MALLTDTQRLELWSEYQQQISRLRNEHGVTKSQLRDVVDAVDQWIEDNSASFNQAIPQPMRAILSTEQKVRIFMSVAKKRFEVL